MSARNKPEQAPVLTTSVEVSELTVGDEVSVAPRNSDPGIEARVIFEVRLSARAYFFVFVSSASW
jgi:hypothetical protein